MHNSMIPANLCKGMVLSLIDWLNPGLRKATNPNKNCVTYRLVVEKPIHECKEYKLFLCDRNIMVTPVMATIMFTRAKMAWAHFSFVFD